jgi:hypothetical protein
MRFLPGPAAAQHTTAPHNGALGSPAEIEPQRRVQRGRDGLPVRAGSIGSARAAAFARGELAGEHPSGDRLAAPQFPGPWRGPDDHTEPAAADIPAVDTDVDPVSSARHSCHRSSLCTMPATAVSWGRAPASRCAAIKISDGVRTLTTTAWARAALDDH